jgi:hypothetical protein
VFPVADPLFFPTQTVGVQDAGPIPFGATLADMSTGLRPNNNNSTETISQIVLDNPLDTPTLTYDVPGRFVPDVEGAPSLGSGTAQVVYDPTTRTYTSLSQAPSLRTPLVATSPSCVRSSGSRPKRTSAPLSP